MIIEARRIDEIIPGDVIASLHVIGFLDTVVAVRVIEHDDREDEIELTLDTTAMSPTITRRASRYLDVVEG